MPKKNDEQLIINYLKGDEKSLEVLIRRYLKPIYSFVYRYIGGSYEAEDITQEVFVRVWRNIKKFDKQKSFKTWIFSIAKNASIDFLKKKKSIPFSEFENREGQNPVIDKLADSSPLPSELFEKKDIVRVITSAIEKISPKYRMVLFLRYNDHFTFREIAETLGESINTVKTRHRRGIAIMKKLLREK